MEPLALCLCFRVYSWQCSDGISKISFPDPSGAECDCEVPSNFVSIDGHGGAVASVLKLSNIPAGALLYRLLYRFCHALFINVDTPESLRVCKTIQRRPCVLILYNGPDKIFVPSLRTAPLLDVSRVKVNPRRALVCAL